MRTQKGSFTIEAIIWIPLMLCLMLYAMETGISFYKESIRSENVQELESWDGVSRFYEIWAWKELEEGMENE